MAKDKVNPGGGEPQDELDDVIETAREAELDEATVLQGGSRVDPAVAVLSVAESAVRINRSTRKLVKATHRVAQTLLDSPALQSTERGVTLRRAEEVNPAAASLWEAIHLHTDAIAFPRYDAFIERVLCGPEVDGAGGLTQRARTAAKHYHVPGLDVYRLLKRATEVFLLLNTGVVPDPADDGRSVLALDATFDRTRPYDVDRLGAGPRTVDQVEAALSTFLADESNNYLHTVVRNAFDSGTWAGPTSETCLIASERLDVPCLLELIWSYWMEEGMLNQTLAAITRRFQNVRRPGRGPDPLTELELDPLRPLNGVIWGYLQDEPGRLSVVRRAYEYNHHYGLTLYGRAVPPLRPADPRARFLEAFHNLLRQAAGFYREDNDTTVIADAFPVLNTLKEVHLVLSEGAHNQFRDLPWQSRAEMMMQQWMLARPEMREFLRGRFMVAYPEDWMGSVDSMKRLQGWTDVSVRYFRDLARMGERLLLSIRYGNWSDINDQNDARAWLRYWKEEVQGYIHAYHSVTGVNLSDDVVEVRERADIRYAQPSMLLRNRLLATRRALRRAP